VDIVSIDTRDATPIYAQLERGLRAAIATSRLRPGDQLPTVRQLAVELRINANTVARVYAELERAGVIETRRGVGSFIAATPAQAHPPAQRDRRLQSFVTRVLADADAAGFTIDDLLTALADYDRQRDKTRDNESDQTAAFKKRGEV
jgi:GntR family transcriptional regulator